MGCSGGAASSSPGSTDSGSTDSGGTDSGGTVGDGATPDVSAQTDSAIDVDTSPDGDAAPEGAVEGDDLFKCTFDPMQWWRDAGVRDITFVAFADPHGMDPTSGCPVNEAAGDNQNVLIREAINSVGAHVWPADAGFYREGQSYDRIRGVLIAGDLTQAGSASIPAGKQKCFEYTAYRAAFGRCGSEGKLLFPVYEAAGNHDYPRMTPPGDANVHPVIDLLDLITADHRPGSASDLYDDPESGTAHHAWRWDDLWFVNVNLKVGYNPEFLDGGGTMRIADPHHSLGFLKGFLLSRANSKTRQLVILSHYPLGMLDKAEKESFCQLIYNAQHAAGDFEGGQKLSDSWPIVAFLHGHNHSVPEYKDWPCDAPYASVVIPQFSVGTPLYGGSQNLPGQMHFTIMRIGSQSLEVVGVGAPADGGTGPWDYVYKDRKPYPVAP